MRPPRTKRNTELALLIFAMLVVTAYSAAVEAGLFKKITPTVAVIPVLMTGAFIAFHIVLRRTAPYADPVIMPAVELLNGMGVAFLRRLELGRAGKTEGLTLSPFTGDSFRQFIWTVAALTVATFFLIIIKDHRVLSKYAYTLGLTGIVLVIIPAVLPARFSEVNGAKLWIKFGGF